MLAGSIANLFFPAQAEKNGTPPRWDKRRGGKMEFMIADEEMHWHCLQVCRKGPNYAKSIL